MTPAPAKTDLPATSPTSPDASARTNLHLSLDPLALNVIIDALDLYTRVSNGQWDTIAARAGTITGNLDPQTYQQLSNDLLLLRARYAEHETLREYLHSYIGIAQCDQSARIAYDLWHAFGGGIADRRDMRIGGVHVEVTSEPTPHCPIEDLEPSS